MRQGLSPTEIQHLYDRYAPGMYRRAFAYLTDPSDLDAPRLLVDSDREPWVTWQRKGSSASGGVASDYRRHRTSGWDAEQLIAGTVLHGFRLDEKGFPWAAVGCAC